MNSLLRWVFSLLLLSSISSFISAFYLFFTLDQKILSAIFFVFFPITLYLSLSLLQNNNSLLTIDQKQIIKNIFPPFLSLFFSNFLSKSKTKRRELLFRGSENLFFQLINESKIYGEYGMGQSTIKAMSYQHLKIYSVDSDSLWVEKIKLSCDKNKHHLKYVDLGTITKWGRPLNYSKKQNIKTYLNYIWEIKPGPDVVLIDGRFRVASFLTSLRECNLGTKIIFDDYVERPQYHIVEEFIKPSKLFGLQAIFEVRSKENLDINKLNNLINKFEYVMD